MSAMTKTKSNSRINRINAPARPELAHAEIALCAMTIWQSEGQPQGRDVEHWLLAEARLSEAREADADATTGNQPRRARRTDSQRSRVPAHS